VITGLVLVFTTSLGFFITTALIGGAAQITIAQIIYIQMIQLYDWGSSSSLAIILLLGVAAMYFALAKGIGIDGLFGIRPATKVTKSPRRFDIGHRLGLAAARIARLLPSLGTRPRFSLLMVMVMLIVMNAPLLVIVA